MSPPSASFRIRAIGRRDVVGSAKEQPKATGPPPLKTTTKCSFNVSSDYSVVSYVCRLASGRHSGHESIRSRGATTRTRYRWACDCHRCKLVSRHTTHARRTRAPKGVANSRTAPPRYPSYSAGSCSVFVGWVCCGADPPQMQVRWLHVRGTTPFRGHKPENCPGGECAWRVSVLG